MYRSCVPSAERVRNEDEAGLVQRVNDTGKLQQIGDLEITGFFGRQGRFPVLIDNEVRVPIGFE